MSKVFTLCLLLGAYCSLTAPMSAGSTGAASITDCFGKDRSCYDALFGKPQTSDAGSATYNWNGRQVVLTTLGEGARPGYVTDVEIDTKSKSPRNAQSELAGIIGRNFEVLDEQTYDNGASAVYCGLKGVTSAHYEMRASTSDFDSASFTFTFPAPFLPDSIDAVSMKKLFGLVGSTSSSDISKAIAAAAGCPEKELQQITTPFAKPYVPIGDFNMSGDRALFKKIPGDSFFVLRADTGSGPAFIKFGGLGYSRDDTLAFVSNLTGIPQVKLAYGAAETRIPKTGYQEFAVAPVTGTKWSIYAAGSLSRYKPCPQKHAESFDSIIVATGPVDYWIAASNSVLDDPRGQ